MGTHCRLAPAWAGPSALLGVGCDPAARRPAQEHVGWGPCTSCRHSVSRPAEQRGAEGTGWGHSCSRMQCEAVVCMGRSPSFLPLRRGAGTALRAVTKWGGAGDRAAGKTEPGLGVTRLTAQGRQAVTCSVRGGLGWSQGRGGCGRVRPALQGVLQPTLGAQGEGHGWIPMPGWIRKVPEGAWSPLNRTRYMQTIEHPQVDSWPASEKAPVSLALGWA